jgi:hypothetical protein
VSLLPNFVARAERRRLAVWHFANGHDRIVVTSE